MLEVRLTAVRVDLRSNHPVVFLQELEGERALPIFIGPAEATAIAYAIQKMRVPRPMTHDLLRDVIDALGATLQRVVVTEVREATYYAELHLLRTDAPIIVSARPSDAIALAARTGSRIFVADDLMDSSGVVLDAEAEADESEEEASEEIVGEFLEFLDNVRPEDFST
jgi:bifunctional DNase/RNase